MGIVYTSLQLIEYHKDKKAEICPLINLESSGLGAASAGCPPTVLSLKRSV